MPLVAPSAFRLPPLEPPRAAWLCLHVRCLAVLMCAGRMRARQVVADRLPLGIGDREQVRGGGICLGVRKDMYIAISSRSHPSISLFSWVNTFKDSSFMTGGSHLSISHPPAAREPSRPAGLVSLHPELAPQPLIDQRTAPSDVFYLLNNKALSSAQVLKVCDSDAPTLLVPLGRSSVRRRGWGNRRGIAAVRGRRELPSQPM